MTVLGLMPRRAAISRLESPAATSRTMSASRGVSTGVLPWGPARAWRATPGPRTVSPRATARTAASSDSADASLPRNPVAAGPQRGGHRLRGDVGAEDEDGGRGVQRAQFADESDAVVDARAQVEVDDGDVRGLGTACRAQGVVGVRRLGHGRQVVDRREQGAQTDPERGVVVDDEDPGGAGAAGPGGDRLGYAAQDVTHLRHSFTSLIHVIRPRPPRPVCAAARRSAPCPNRRSTPR